MSEESLQWPEGVCEVCGEPAEMHITRIDKGQVSVRHVCFDHSLPTHLLERMPEEFRAKRRQWIEAVRARRDRGD